MYMVIAMDASGREYLMSLHAVSHEASEEAHELRRKWTSVRVSCRIESVKLLGALVNRWETM